MNKKSHGHKASRKGKHKAKESHSDKATSYNLDSYNRVTRLDSQKASWGFLVACIILLAIGGAEFTPWPMHLGGFVVMGVTIPWLVIVAAVLLAAFSVIYSRRQKSCRFCGDRLETVIRPLVLKNELLSRPGIIIDGTFFSLMGHVPKHRQWMKLHQRSFACHHCRIYEASHFRTYEALTPAEDKKLQLALDKDIK